MSRMLAVLIALAPAAAIAASPREADTRRDLRDAERQNSEQLAARKDAADRAARAAAKALLLAQEQVEAAAKLRQAETATADLAARIDALAQQRREAEQRVQIRAKAMQPLLPLIERLSLYPAETLLAVPAPPDAALRGVLVLQGLSRQIEIETEALRRDQAAVDAAAAALRQAAPQLAEAEAAQKREADALDQEIADAHAEQAAAEAQANQAASQAADAAARMDTLRSALAALEAQRRADEAKAREEAARADRQKNTAEAQAARGREAVAAHPTGAGTIASGAGPHGQLQPPVIGVVVKAWGEPDRWRPGDGRVLSRAAGRARDLPLRRAGRLRAELPQLRAVADHRLRRRLPRGAVRLRPAGREAGPKPGGRGAGRRDADVGTRIGRASSVAVCGAAARRDAGEPGAVAALQQLIRRRGIFEHLIQRLCA